MREEKYIKLLLKKCLDIQKNGILFINFASINKDFVDKIVEYAKELELHDIYLNEIDKDKEHELLKKLSLDEIKNSEYFNSKIWDEYAEKDAAFLMLDCEIPNLMDDIDSDKLALAASIRRSTKPVYREKQLKSEIAWCIAAVPNELWAKDIFKDSENPLEDFWVALEKICMLDQDDPIESWNKQLDKQRNFVNKLNNLKITKLHYKNDLGTDLEVCLPDKALWQSAASGKWLVNLPSYEIFTTPNYKLTEGIVYSSKPLVYNCRFINDFYLKFEKGKVVDFDAKDGKDILEEIIKTDELSSYLGEVALVNFDSPISNTNIIFKSTLFDENASCHLALGNGFLECLENGSDYSNEELDCLGINLSRNHVDFMIGTEDLTIEAETKDGIITIMEKGNLVI